MSPPACPGDERLLRGDEPEIAAHLEGCPACRERRAALDADDRFLARVREAWLEGAPAWMSSTGADARGADDLVPGFRLLGVIARGGQGTVHAARDESTGDVVALKIVGRAGRITAKERLRFEREAQLAARLDHPGIARVLASGTCRDGRPYLAMERVDGVPLDDHALFAAGRDGDAAARRRATELLLAIAEAVAAAHGRGVIHRDLKPGNILVDADGAPRIIDFGLARTFAEDAGRATRTGEFVGSVAYASREQLAGEADVDARADVHALGVIGYEMLVGHGPWDSSGSLEALVHERLEREPRRPRELDPRLDPDLDAILHAAVHPDPQRRYPSAEALARDLRLHLEEKPIEVRRDSRWYVVSRSLRRHRVGIAVATVAALALVAVAIVTAVGWRRASDAERLARARSDALALALLESDVDQARLAVAAGDLARAEALAWRVRLALDDAGAAVADAAAPLGPRAEWILRDVYARAPVAAATTLPEAFGSGYLAWSSDGRAVRVIAPDGRELRWVPEDGDPVVIPSDPAARPVRCPGCAGGAAIVRADGALELPLAGDGGPPRTIRVSLSPDVDGAIEEVDVDGAGRRVLLRTAPGTWILQDAAGERRLRLDGHLSRGRLSPDGRFAAVAREDGRLALWRLDPPEPLAVVGSTKAGTPCFSPDGRRFAYSEGIDVHVHRLPDPGTPDAGAPLETTCRGEHRWITSLSFDAAGARLLASGWDRLVMIWDRRTGARLATWAGHEDRVGSAAFAPGGRRVASLDGRRVLRTWHAAPDAAAHVVRRHVTEGTVMDLALVPGAGAVCATDDAGRVHLVRANAPAGDVRTLALLDDIAGTVAAVPDGSGVVVGTYDGGVHRLGLDGTRAWTASFPGVVSDVAVDPAGTLVAAACADGAVRTFDLATGTVRGEHRWFEGRVVALAWAPGGTHLAAAGHDGTVRYAAVAGAAATGGPARTPPAPVGRVVEGVARTVAIDPSGRWLAYGGDDRVRHVVDLHAGREVAALTGAGGAIFALAFDASGRRLASIDASGEGQMAVGPPWTSVQREPVHSTMGFAVLFAPDGDALLSAGRDGEIVVRDLDAAAARIEGMRAYWRSRRAGERRRRGAGRTDL